MEFWYIGRTEGVMEFMSENCGVNVPTTDKPKYEALAWLGLETHSTIWNNMNFTQQSSIKNLIDNLVNGLPQNCE